MARQHRQPIRADLVRKIAIGADPVGSHEHDIDLGLPHERARRAVGNQRARDSGVHQLPDGET